MKALIILWCIISVWYIDYNTNQIEKQIDNPFETITQEELLFQKNKFENQMKTFDDLIFNNK